MVQQSKRLLRNYHKLRPGKPFVTVQKSHRKNALDQRSKRWSRLKNEKARRCKRRAIR